jgi:hypothetical protein
MTREEVRPAEATTPGGVHCASRGGRFVNPGAARHVFARLQEAKAAGKRMKLELARMFDDAFGEAGSWMDAIPNGKGTLRELMQARARALKARLPQGALSSVAAGASTILKQLDGQITSIAEVADGRRRGKKTAAQHPVARMQERVTARSRIGQVACCFHNGPLPSAASRRRMVVEEWHPCTVGCQEGPLPERTYGCRKETHAQAAQKAEVTTWGLRRLGETEVRFAYAKVRDTVKSWRHEQRAKGRHDWEAAQPPLRMIREAVANSAATSVTCSAGSQLWDGDGPLDCLQQAAAFGVPMSWRGAVAAVRACPQVSDAAIRALFGQCVHWCTGRLIAQRIRAKIGRHPRSFAQLGAGWGLLGAALHEEAETAGGTIEYLWMAEADGIAQQAHEALWRHTGQAPRRFARAEEVQDAPRAEVELISLRCAPFSQANASGKGINAAIRELEAAMELCALRRPKCVVYENVDGVWRNEARRKQVQGALAAMGKDYVWEVIRTSPHVHGGAKMRRWRIFYIGVRVD